MARLIKAKSKADRAAAKGSASASTSDTPATIEPLVAPSKEGSPVPNPEDTTSKEAEENAENSTALPSIEAISPAPSRLDMLRAQPIVVGRFMELLVPILVDVYAASVVTPIRVKTLTALLKAVSFLDADGLKRVFMVCLQRCLRDIMY